MIVKDDSEVKELDRALSTVYPHVDAIYITGTKQFRQSYFEDAMINDIIVPIVPANVAAEISFVQTSNATYYEKSQQLQEVFNKYIE